MNDLMLATYVKTDIALRSMRDRLTRRPETGADALEYIGMVVLAALIIAGVFGVVATLDPKGTFETAAKEILNKK